MPRTTDIHSGLTSGVLREIVRYEPTTGKFYWLKSNNQSASIGGEAGTVEPNTGYVRFTILGRKYQAHRLAWLYVHGVWPECEIDHRDLDKTNNTISNLRQAVPANNASNKRVSKRNILGIKGVSLRRDGKFVARIGHRNEVICLGTFGDVETARAAYVEKARELHGEFARSA